MYKLIILDFSTGNVDIYLAEQDCELDMDNLIPKLGYNPNNCEWMYSNGSITFHKEVLK